MPIRLRPAIGFSTACFVLLLSAGGVGVVIGAQAPVQPPSTSPAAPRAPDAPVRDPAKPPAAVKRSAIRGRVVALDSGTPLRRVLVRVVGGSELRMPRASYTDAQGNYEVKDLSAGRYQLQASKGGFVPIAYGQRRPFEGGRPLELADGQTLEKVDFHLPRGGVIVGRIVDELGEAVTGAGVKALVSRRVGGSRRLIPFGYGSTNDIGQYRLFGLPPGEYYVTAGGADSVDAVGMTDNPSGSGYAPTYYPGTPSLAEAQRITVNVGAEVSADLQLTPTRVSKVSGTIVDQSGRPALAAFVSLQRREPAGEDGASFSSASVGVEGAFSISNVAPGAYYLVATVIDEFGSVQSVQRSSGWAPISVTGQDLEGIRIVATKGATVKGRVIYEGGARPTNPLGIPPHVGCEAADPDGPTIQSHGTPAKVDEQGQFALTGVYQDCVIRAHVSDDWGLAAVTHGSQDVTDRPLAIKDTETITDVTITVTNQLAKLTGTVTDADNRPAKDYVVIVFPEDADKLGRHSRFVRSARADQEGQFKMKGLPPGEYFAAALDSVEEGAEFDPEFLDRIRSSSVPLRLGDDGQQTISLKLIKPMP